jgi:hypothetical protein
MPDTRFVEGGYESPRRYTPAELEAIAKAAGVRKCGPVALEKLQQAVEAYQWADEADSGGLFFRSNKERHNQLKRILKLQAENTPAETIDEELEEIDAVTSQLLGQIRAGDPKARRRAARRALKALSRHGPNPKRARLQFVTELISIFEYAIRRRAGRNVHASGQEQGEFHAFVVEALRPFKAAMGCEADIKLALTRHKTRLPHSQK